MAGFPPPSVALKLILPGLLDMVGGGSAKVSVTDEVVWGVSVATEPVMVMVALWVPACNPVISTLTVTLSVSPVEVPFVCERLSPAALSLTLQLSVPPPLLLICKV